MDDSSLNPDLVREKDVVVGLVLQYKKGDKPEWNDIFAQGVEFRPYWAQWENLVIEGEGLLCRVSGVRKIPEDAGCVAAEFGGCCIGHAS